MGDHIYFGRPTRAAHDLQPISLLGVSMLPDPDGAIWVEVDGRTSLPCTTDGTCIFFATEKIRQGSINSACSASQLGTAEAVGRKVYGMDCTCSGGAAAHDSSTPEEMALAPYGSSPADELQGLPPPFCRAPLEVVSGFSFALQAAGLPEIVQLYKGGADESFEILVPLYLLSDMESPLPGGNWSVAALQPLAGTHNIPECTGYPELSGVADECQTQCRWCEVSQDGGMLVFDYATPYNMSSYIAHSGYNASALDESASVPPGVYRISGRPLTVLAAGGAWKGDVPSFLHIPMVASAAGLRETGQTPFAQQLRVTIYLGERLFERDLKVQISVTAAGFAESCTYLEQGAAQTYLAGDVPHTTDECICRQGCNMAPNDGVCDDGGPGSSFSSCDYGTVGLCLVPTHSGTVRANHAHKPVCMPFRRTVQIVARATVISTAHVFQAVHLKPAYRTR